MARMAKARNLPSSPSRNSDKNTGASSMMASKTRLRAIFIFVSLMDKVMVQHSFAWFVASTPHGPQHH
ncbi:Uncharacterised protein [Mycobacterium tuberculosis]|nr:Uncharacterised protein [Mycobacterium tuberculosis]